MTTRLLPVIALAAAATATIASASSRHREHGHEEHRRGRDRGDASAVDPTYAKECGACHLAYPPHLLPPRSWRVIMSRLDAHFGSDAALEPEVRDAIERWLVERASRREDRAGDGAPLRITELDWFRRKHRKVPPAAAARPSIRSMANCAACHPRAAAWDFDDDRVMIPRE